MSESPHINSAFDADLSALNDDVAQLGALAQAQLSASLAALTSRDMAAIEAVIARDDALDQLEAQVAERAVQLIALRHPMAEDLRSVMVAIKVATALERIGDFAKSIARRNRAIIAEGVRGAGDTDLLPMARQVQDMLNAVLDAYMERDITAAHNLRASDIEIDRLHARAFEAIVAHTRRAPEQAVACAHWLFIAKGIERVGDYVTGIAEQICFLVDGVVPSDARPKQPESEPKSEA